MSLALSNILKCDPDASFIFLYIVGFKLAFHHFDLKP